jgi:hypothetical protein
VCFNSKLDPTTNCSSTPCANGTLSNGGSDCTCDYPFRRNPNHSLEPYCVSDCGLYGGRASGVGGECICSPITQGEHCSDLLCELRSSPLKPGFNHCVCPFIQYGGTFCNVSTCANGGTPYPVSACF